MIVGPLHRTLLLSPLCGRVRTNEVCSRSVLSRFITLYPCLMMYTALSHNTSSVPWIIATCLSICSCFRLRNLKHSPVTAPLDEYH